MATITGAITPSNIVQESFVSPSLEFETNNLQNYIGIAPQAAIAGVLTENTVNVASYEKNAAKMRSFGDLWFNKLHLIPALIDVGNLTGNQTREIEIFNAYLEETVSIDDRTEGGNLSGVDFDLNPIENFAPLESRTFLLSINLTGSPEFAGFYELETSVDQPLRLDVSGRRVIVFPFRVDWANGVKEEINFHSKVFEAERSIEQRVLHNRGKARRSIEYDHIFANSNDADDQNNLRVLFDSMVYGWQQRNFILPLRFDETLLENAISAGAQFVPTITAFRDFEAGSYLILWRNEYDFEAGEIEDVLAHGVQLSRPLEKSFPKVTTRILPGRTAFLLDDDVDVDEINSNIHAARIVWQIAPPMSQSANRFAAPGFPQYRGFDVFTKRETENTDRTRTSTRKIGKLDFRIGGIWREARDIAPRARFPVRLHLIGRSEIAQFLSFFNDKKGRLKPFWYNGKTRDFQLLETTPPNADSLKVRANGQAAFRALGKNRRDIVIKLISGATYFRRLTSAIESNNEETLVLDAPIANSFAPSQVEYISFLRPVRFDVDKIALNWITVDKAYTQFNLFDLIEL